MALWAHIENIEIRACDKVFPSVKSIASSQYYFVVAMIKVD